MPVYQSDFSGAEIDARLAAVASLQTAIGNLEAAIAAKYSKPAAGIPETDLDASVQAALALARTAVQSLANYYTKAQVDDIAAAIAATVDSTSGVVVTTLPTAAAGTLGKIYYVGPDASGFYDRYVTSYDGSSYSWLALGNTEINLANYATKEYVDDVDVLTLTDYKTWPFLLLDTGYFGTNDSYYYVLIPCQPGDRFALWKEQSNTPGRYAWFTEYVKATAGQAAPLVAGTGRYEYPVNETTEVTAPIGANFLYVQVYTSLATTVKKIRGVAQAVSQLEAASEVATPIDIDSISWTGGRIDENGNWQNTARYRHIVVPCEGGDTFVMRGTYDSRYAFLKSYGTPVNGEPAPLVDGTTRSDSFNGVDVRLTTPAGTKYLYLYSGDGSISHAATRWNLPQVLEKVEDVAALAAKQKIMLDEMKESTLSGDILSLNPPREFVPKFMSATKRYYTSTSTGQPYPLVFLQLSDIHGNWANVERFLQFADEYEDYIDDLVNTGDTVSGLYTDGVAGYNAIEGVDKILAIIGNHETREGNDWQAHIGLDAYNLIIAPHVSEWDVVQPAGAAENGYCYYYKDYAAKNIRAVFVDIMGYDDTEDAWLAGVLAAARTAGYHVVIFTHYAGARSEAESDEAVFEKVACNYTSLYPLGSDSSNLTAYNVQAYKMNDTVNAFMVAGGHFVGYVQGHYHTDFVAKCAKYPDQMIYAIGATKAGEMRDFNHVVGTRNQDEFQVVAIDTVNTIVKLFKVGAFYDRYGRSKGSVCINYSTGEVLGEGQ